jgi:VWFA-related protein
MRFTRLASTILLIAPLALAPSLAQNPPAPGTTAPTLKVYSRETIVDVTVTDAKGNPVHGLTQSNFTVKEDHKPQPIRSFEEFRALVPPRPELPPHTYTNLQPSTGATNILLLDGLNSAPPDSANPDQVSDAFGLLATAKNEVRKYLRTMPVGTPVAVLGLSSLHLQVLQNLTSDRQLLGPSIDGAQIDLNGRAFNPESWCAQRASWNEATMDALEQIAAYVSGIKGKKNLIWFTVPNPTLTEPAMRPKCLPDPSVHLQKAYDLLMASQVAVYPIDIVRPSPLDGMAILSLESIAEATGGEAFYHTNDLAGAMGRAIDHGSSYYTLSYPPPSKEYDGRHHSIDIKVDKPGLKLAYRNSYYADDPAAIRVAPGLSSANPPEIGQPIDVPKAMGRNMPTSHQILFDVQIEPSTTAPTPAEPPGTILGTLDPAVKAKLKDKPLTRYGFSYSIPAAQLTFTPAPGNTHKGSVELDLAAFDTDGKLVTGLSQTVTMPLADARYKQFIQGPFRFVQQIDLPPGQLFLRIGVLDRTSNKVGTLEIPLTVPKY